jgi:hypothetical protein
VFTADGYAPETVSETIAEGERRVLPVIMKPSPGSSAAAALNNAGRTTPDPLSSSKPSSGAVGPVGNLELTADVPVDVFMNGKLMGKTPVTLELPAGPQRIEYRYLGYEKTISHIIKRAETTKATITFDVNLQINARPWAQVSLDGPRGRSLGQTPLGNVTVPAGSVLVFQNPGFPAKKYRVTGRETAVQIVFP